MKSPKYIYYPEIVVGGGISGLYYLYQYPPQHKTLIIEKNNEWGGRIQTRELKYDNETFNIESGASRFNQNHHNLIQLINELNLQDKIQPIQSITQFKPTYLSSFHPKQTYYYIEKVYKYYLKHPNSPDLHNKTYIEYARKVLNENEIKFICDSFGYTSELTKTNAKYAIELFHLDFSPKNQFYGLNGGLSQIIHKLVQNLSKNKNIKMKLNSDLQNIKYNPLSKLFTLFIKHQNKSTITIYKTHQLILAIPKPSLKNFFILNPIKRDLNRIHCIPLLRYYSLYGKEKDTNKYWFEDIGKTTTNHWIRYIIPLDKKKGLVMTSYTDGIFAKKMNKRIENGTDEEDINKGLKKIMDFTELSKPKISKKYYWDCGVGLWKKGNYNYEDVSKKMLKPFKKMRMYIIGENYSLNQGWIEGALTSVLALEEEILNRSIHL